MRLLMGEQLYADPAMAVRELYQNSLDACRYRQARTEQLHADGAPPAPWAGRITLRQGRDPQTGQAWLECADTGVGMGREELSTVFSTAGVRFPETPEFVAEHAAWAERGMGFTPNSRFGIGVLSYFMLADRFSVTTTAYRRDGTLGPELAMTVTGPGELCQVRPTGRAPAASGTTVRLLLRGGVEVSCVDLLKRLLWVGEYEVSADDGTTTATWQPGVLADTAPVGADDPYRRGVAREATAVHATMEPDVWWCDSSGALLADGLWVGAGVHGCIVNLTGTHSPRLSVDRRRLLDHDADHVIERAAAAAPDLLTADPAILTPAWLTTLTSQSPDLADAIATTAIARGHTWTLTWTTPTGEQVELPVDTSRVGLCHLDQALLQQGDTADELAEWRFASYLAAGLVPGVRSSWPGPPLAMLPSDLILLSEVPYDGPPRLDVNETVSLGHVYSCALTLDRTPASVATRLCELGVSVPDVDWPTTRLDDDDGVFLTYRCDGGDPWLDKGDAITVGHLVLAAEGLDQTPVAVAARLHELGLTNVQELPANGSTTRDDAVLLSQFLDAHPPWLSGRLPVPREHVLVAAATLRRPPAEVAARLREFGHLVTATDWPTVPLTETDAVLLSRGLDRRPPWLTHSVAPGHVLRAADLLDRPATEVVTRLRELGHAVVPAAWPQDTSPDDAVLLSGDLERQGSWLKRDRVVGPRHVSRAAAKLGRSPAEVAERLRAFGYAVARVDWPTDPLDDADAVLLSVDLGGGLYNWLPDDGVVGPGHVSRAAGKLGRSPAEVAERLRTFGYAPARVDWPTSPAGRDDITLLSRDLTGRSPWLDEGRPVGLGHVLGAAAVLGRSPAEVAERLRGLGLAVVDAGWSTDPEVADDALLLSDRLDGRSPWLDVGHVVGAARVVAAAAVLGRSAAEVAERLRGLGLAVVDAGWSTDPVAADDALLLSRNLDGRNPWLEPTWDVPITHVSLAADRLQRPAYAVADRLRELGLTVHGTYSASDRPVREDLILLSQKLDGEVPELSMSPSAVPRWHLLRAALALHIPPGEVVRRLEALGLPLPGLMSTAAGE